MDLCISFHWLLGGASKSTVILGSFFPPKRMYFLFLGLSYFFKLFFLKIDIFFLYISNVISFPGFLSKNSLSHAPSCSSSTHPLSLPVLAFLYTGALSLLRTKGHSSLCCPTRPSSATYAAGASGSLHVYSFVGGLVPGSSVNTGWFIFFSSCGAGNPYSSLGPSSSSAIRDPVLSSMVG